MQNTYERSALSRVLGIGTETLRYYERIGLIPAPERNRSRYRVYTEEDVQRLKFIRKMKELGFGIKEMAAVLKMLNADRNKNDELLKMQLSSKIKEVEKKIDDLSRLKEMLEYARSYPNLGECSLLSFYYETC